MRKEIRLKDLCYSGFDLLYYMYNQDRVYVCIDDYIYSNDEDIEGWHEITDVFVYEFYKYYFVDRLTIFENGGFGLRISMPPRRIEKFRVFLLKLFKR